MATDMSWMRERYEYLQSQGLEWNPPTLESASEPRCIMDGKEVIMLSSNNYLNLTTHPKVIQASIEAIEKYGAGSGSVRAIAGTLDIHLQAEKICAEFKEVEAALIYSSGYAVNVGLIPTLVKGHNDVIISDELNHGSIIDGVRLTKASRSVYSHNDMGELENILNNHKNSDRKLIITDGVFSMDGDIAPLGEITKLAEEHDAMIFVDDCHGEGVLGEGKGIVSHFGLQGRVNFEVGSYSKALGVQGGILAGSDDVRRHALNHSRSWLLSGSQPPAVAAAQKASIEVLMSEPEHVEKLWNNTNYFRENLQSLGFDTGASETPIIPVMCKESKKAQAMSRELRNEGVMVGAIVLTYRKREGVKKQSYFQQVSREREDSVKLVDVEFEKGVNVDD